MSVNLTKLKREKLLKSLEEINNTLLTEHPEMSQQLRDVYNEIEKKKYGLSFEEHEEKIDAILKDNVPVLVEDPEKRITKNAPYNFIIEGDNLASLKLLERTHKERIGVIYIDPPYNRGKNDFIYDDDFVGEDDYFRHSKWLSFMKKRLEIAKNLLTYDGVIFISIDDKEGFDLKMLCDDVFGIDNLISCMPRITKKSGKSTVTFSKNHDYVLVYVKNNTNVFVAEDHIDPGFKYKDEYFDERGPYKLNQTLDYDTLGYVYSLDFPIEFNGKTYYPGTVTEAEFKARKEENPKDGYRWRWSLDLVKFGIEHGWVEANDKTGRLYTKTYLKATIKKVNGKYEIQYTDRTKPISSIDFVENIYSNDNARKELDSFGIKEKFDYPKPSSLIKRLVKSYFDKNAIVLDFFAGSGTTAQAVMNLNAEDGGNRTFILCTNNQNGICENITYERVKKVINGFSFEDEIKTAIYEKKLTARIVESGINKNEIDKIIREKESEFDSIEKCIEDGNFVIYGVKKSQIETKGFDASLKYFKVDFVETKARTYLDYSDDLLDYCKPMVELQNGVDFDSNTDCMLIMDDDTFDDLVSNIQNCSGKRIFLGNNVLASKEQKTLILESGNDLFILPDYFYKE